MRYPQNQMDKIMKFTGYKDSPKDRRDFKLSQVQPTDIEIPEVFMPDYSMLPSYHQQKQPSCIGHSVAWMINLNEYFESNKKDNLSPRFIYSLCKKFDGIPDEDGTYYRLGLKIAKDYGCPEDSFFPNNVNLDRETYNNADLISNEAKENAEPRKIKSYVRVDDMSFDGLKKAIFKNKAILLGIVVDENMYTAKDGRISWLEKDILPLRLPKGYEGHAVVAIGYDKDYIYFQNSWGRGWGRSNIGYFGKNYIPFIKEGWLQMDLPNEKIEELKKAQRTLIQILTDYIELLKIKIKEKTFQFFQKMDK